MTDFTEKQELAGGLANISQGPCRICEHASTQRMQDGNVEFDDGESQFLH